MKKLIFSIAILSFMVSCKNGDKKVETEAQEVQTEEVQTVESPKIQGVDFTWTAFKTPEKKGVNGTFENITYGDLNAGETLEAQFKGLTYSMDKMTVVTGDPARDTTLKTQFFEKLVGGISGKILEVKDGKAQLEITLNDKTISKEFTFTPSEDGKSVALEGSIDLLEDFGANTAFDSLHTACNVLHEGKTWTDVNLKAVIKL